MSKLINKQSSKIDLIHIYIYCNISQSVFVKYHLTISRKYSHTNTNTHKSSNNPYPITIYITICNTHLASYPSSYHHS